MKIAILTIQSDNYGNRLQNYALQTVLERQGHDVASLQRYEGAKGFVRHKARSSKLVCRLMAGKHGKKVAFCGFDRDFIVFSSKVVSANHVSHGLDSAYDCFVIGSDQVWNPAFSFNSEVEYLPMVAAGKKISYAASFGVSKIDGGRTAELLDGIGSISVREAAGADIVRGLTGRDAAVVLDPALLLGPEDWVAIAKKPTTVECNRPFVFKYVLGDDVNAKRIEQVAHDRDLQVIDAMDSSLAIGPSEFVWLIAHSELVCTDSFHASVFALLHHKPLAIFERVSGDVDMSSRFDTLCEAFSLEAHRSSNDGFGDEAVFGTDWDAFERHLEELRLFSQGWLESAIAGATRG